MNLNSKNVKIIFKKASNYIICCWFKWNTVVFYKDELIYFKLSSFIYYERKKKHLKEKLNESSK